MAAGTINYYRTAERPGIALWWVDDDGTLIDFSTGYTFDFKIGTTVGATAAFTKTAGITGAAGSGTSPTGTPNVTIAFSAAELDAIAAGYYTWQLRATSGGVDRISQGSFVMHDVLL
jgi:hypothetical protein